LFLKELDKLNLILNQGRIIDASSIEIPTGSVPQQRNSCEENKQIKSGEVPHEFANIPNKLAQKDLDARWTKRIRSVFSAIKIISKLMVKSERRCGKIITKYHLTDASLHDSQALDTLLDDTDIGQDLHADSAYIGQKPATPTMKNFN